MTIVQMLEQSVVLTLLGMGVVFSFLVILVITVSLAGKIIAGVGRDIQPAAAGGSASAGPENAAVTAAISAAVNEYQKTR